MAIAPLYFERAEGKEISSHRQTRSNRLTHSQMAQSVHWPGVFAPTLTTTADKKDYISFFYDGLSYDALGFTKFIK